MMFVFQIILLFIMNIIINFIHKSEVKIIKIIRIYKNILPNKQVFNKKIMQKFLIPKLFESQTKTQNILKYTAKSMSNIKDIPQEQNVFLKKSVSLKNILSH